MPNNPPADREPREMTVDQWIDVAGILGLYTPGPDEKPSPWDHLNIGGKLARALTECRAQLREAEREIARLKNG